MCIENNDFICLHFRKKTSGTNRLRPRNRSERIIYLAKENEYVLDVTIFANLIHNVFSSSTKDKLMQ